MNKSSQEQLIQDFLSRNPDERARARVLIIQFQQARVAEDTARTAAIYEQLKPYAQNNQMVRMMLKLSNPDRKVLKGQPVPAFSTALLDGQGTASRESLAGRFYLVDFWATWCGPCVEEMPRLHTAWEKFKGRGGFTILSVSLDGSEEQVKQFRGEKWKMPWLNTFAGQDFEAPLPKAFETHSIPHAILVDARGNIIAEDMELRGEQLERTLDALLPQ